ncbi:MAG TPA: heme biosynthesis HemY N-terminal domain-containing protein [Beijerinckiaceae bacterium]|nr:heme biosynthesis HemY N-terminal domain-containing protein [Beijerinckiaceae bacterium]
MIRVLSILILLALAAFGFAWLANRPGDLVLTFQNLRFETSLPVALVALILAVVVIWMIFALIRLVIGMPGFLSSAGRERRREKGRRALSRGMIAAAAGDLRAARSASVEANRRLGAEPLALLLEAQSAQLAGDRPGADRAFARMAERVETRLLGLRGLHSEALRRGDSQAAHDYAARAHAIAPLPWAAQAVLDHHAGHEDWAKALVAVDANLAHKTIDRKTADRQRAVLMTAMALDLGERDPDQALRLSQDALRLAPGLVPAAAIAAGVLTQRQEIRKAAKTIEAAWRLMPHPDLARAYLAIRPGDSANDRLVRAETLARLDREHPESRMVVARAALEARDALKARAAMAPLVENGQPTRRMCLLMADIEETEHGRSGALREWLARAARAPRDPAWVADGYVSDTWLPVSPVTGKLDAFVWKTPEERLSAPNEPPPPVLPPIEPPEDRPQPQPASIEAPVAERLAEDGRGSSPKQAERLASAVVASASVVGAENEGPREGVNANLRAESGLSRTSPRPVLFTNPAAPDDPGPMSEDHAVGAE